jgi:hypothetical protein
MKQLRTALAAALLAAACASEPPVSNPNGQPLTEADWRAAIASQSCPDDAAFLMGVEVPLVSRPVPLSVDGPAALDGATFLAGFHLTSPDPRFGGLSGLEFTRSGNLIAVSDMGAFVWIGFDAETLTPASTARIGEMYGADGKYLEGKSDRDSEGLALTEDGLALVSFERDHRVLGFDLEGCGAAARGVEIAAWSRTPLGMSGMHGANRGAEGLSIGPGGALLVSIEENDGNSPFGPLLETGAPDLTARIETPGLLSVTGSDRHEDWLYTVHRFYAPGVGNKIAIARSELDETGAPTGLSMQLAYLEAPLNVDNFEAIAVRKREDGSLLIAVISDNNFSSRQRTLLYLFEVERP